jgi:1,4-dihydroxy-2-naphthoate octaprenyltransferase
MTSAIGSQHVGFSKWLAGARPRTLPAAIAPVLVGTSLIHSEKRSINLLNGLAALLVSLLLQIAVNFSNDYSDGIRGTDKNRVGPMRLVASGLATAKHVKAAAYFCFFLASFCGLFLASRTSWWLIPSGLICIIAAWTYTGGAKPYGYSGFGEISVFIFFGVVATVGSYFVQSGRVTWQSFLLSVPMGTLSCAILCINNLRDLPKDAVVGKKTLAVRIGDKNARKMFVALIVLAHFASLLIFLITPWALVTILFLPMAVRISQNVMGGAQGAALIPILGKVGKLQLFIAVALAIALLTQR